MKESIHLTSLHQVFDTRVFQKEIHTLAKNGYRVTYILPHTRDEEVRGVRIKAVPPPKDGKERLSRTLRLVYQAALQESPDAIFHFHDAELLPWMLLLKLKGRHVVYDSHEDTPRQILYQHWIPSLLRRPIALIMGLMEKVAGRLFDGIIAAEPVIYKNYPADNCVLVRNYPIKDELTTTNPVPYQERDPVIAYVGGLTEIRGVFEMIGAIDQVPDHLQARLVLGGPFFPAELKEEIARTPGAGRVQTTGWLDRPEVADTLGKARAGIVTVHPTKQYLGHYPTKLFEYMSTGLPVIASNFPNYRSFVDRADCGLLVNPLDTSEIAEAITWILTHPDEAEAMGQRGRAYVEEELNWEAEGEKLIDFYDNLVATIN